MRTPVVTSKTLKCCKHIINQQEIGITVPVHPGLFTYDKAPYTTGVGLIDKLVSVTLCTKCEKKRRIGVDQPATVDHQMCNLKIVLNCAGD